MALARNHINEQTNVKVTHAMPIGSKLVACVIKFENDKEDYEDIFNCEGEEARKAILSCTPESPVDCTVTPDGSDDLDKHPSINTVGDQAAA